MKVKKNKMHKQKLVFGLFGAGGFAREVMPFAKLIIEEKAKLIGKEFIIYFIETTPTAKQVNNIPIISEEDFLKLECAEKLFNIAVADSISRERIANKFIENGSKPISLISPQAVIYENNEIGVGAIICAFSTVTSNAKIGKFFHSNIYSYVAHDCIVGDYVTFAPRVNCNGNVHIKDYAYVGTSAVIKQGSLKNPIIIGENSIVGMGAVVTKKVDENTTVVGNPAKIFIKN